MCQLCTLQHLDILRRQVFNLKKIYICQSGPALNDISNLKINADILYKVTVMNGFGFSPSVHECSKTSLKTKFNYCHLMEILMWTSAVSEILAFSARQQGKSCQFVALQNILKLSSALLCSH